MDDSLQESPAAAGRTRARVALAAIVLLCLVGAGVAWDLTRVWVLSRTDPDYHSFCAVSEGMNCETVALSSWSAFLGAPNSVWALAAYAFGALLAGLAATRRRDGLFFGLLSAYGLGLAAFSLWLLGVMHFVIGSLCILCLALDVVNLSVLAFAVVAARGVGVPLLRGPLRDVAALVRRPLVALALAAAGFGLLAGAWAYGNALARDTGAERAPRPAAHVEPHADGGSCGGGDTTAPRAGPQTGVTEAGVPWIGAANPVVEIHEFTDYECPHCRRAHMMVRKILSTAGDRVRVYHRHLPLDQACNPTLKKPLHRRACELSRVAVCAGRQGRFWEMNDLLFQSSDEIREKELSARELAARLELDADAFACCMDEESTRAAVAGDVTEATTLGVKGTPAFVIGGAVHYGKIPAEVLSAAGIPVP